MRPSRRRISTNSANPASRGLVEVSVCGIVEMALWAHGFPCVWVAPLCNAIQNVLRIIPKEKMLGIYARRIVALVADKTRVILFYIKVPNSGQPVRSDSPSEMSGDAVAFFGFGTLPIPTTIPVNFYSLLKRDALSSGVHIL